MEFKPDHCRTRLMEAVQKDIDREQMKKMIDSVTPVIKKFVRPAGHNCKVSTGIHDCLTFGFGELDHNGFWEHGCYECARAHEEQFPGEACWPHTKEWIDGSNAGEENG